MNDIIMWGPGHTGLLVMERELGGNVLVGGEGWDTDLSCFFFFLNRGHLPQPPPPPPTPASEGSDLVFCCETRGSKCQNVAYLAEGQIKTAATLTLELQWLSQTAINLRALT